MKKITLALIGLLYFNIAFSQTYTTGLVQLSNTSELEYSIQIDVNSTITTLTMIGPDDIWLGIGFDVQDMIAGKDVVIYDGVSLTDRYYGYPGQPEGQLAQGLIPSEDAEGERDWTTTSDTFVDGVRTIVATRENNTGNVNDYVFSPTATSIDLVWARGNYHGNEMVDGFELDWHGIGNRGITMQGLTLSQEDFTVNDFDISPNPANTNFTISLPNFTENATISVYDVLGKKVFNGKLNSISSTIDVSQWNSGIYLVRVSTENATLTKRLVKQ